MNQLQSECYHLLVTLGYCWPVIISILYFVSLLKIAVHPTVHFLYKNDLSIVYECWALNSIFLHVCLYRA